MDRSCAIGGYVNIGVIGPTGGEEFAENIADALRRMGQNVFQLGPAHPARRSRRAHNATYLIRMAMPRLDEHAQAKIASAASAAACDVVINIDLRLMPSTVMRLKRDGIRVAFWFPDTVAHLGRQLMILSAYDALFFKEPQLVERLRSNLDMPVYYLPEACNPVWHRPMGPAGTEPYLVAAGTMQPVRVRLLERLIAKGVPLRIYGMGVPSWIGETSVREAHAARYVTRQEKAKVFRSAAGVLNTMSPGEIDGVNGRLFQAAGCGAAVLTEFRPVLGELFEIGNELLTFRTFDELVDGASRLLGDPGLSAKLGDRAAIRAHRDHTYERRLTTILEKVT